MKDSETESDIGLKFEAELNEELELIAVTMPSIQTQIPGMTIARIYILIINILAQFRQNKTSLNLFLNFSTPNIG